MKNPFKKTGLGLFMGIALGWGVAHAPALTHALIYVPTWTGPTQASVTLACEEPGYHAYTFYIANEAPNDPTYDAYYEVIRKLRFYLDTNFVNNVNLTNLNCSTPLHEPNGNDVYINCANGSYTQTWGNVNLKVTSTLTMNANGTATVTMSYDDPNRNDTTPSTRPWITTVPGYDNSYQQSIGFRDNGNVESNDIAITESAILREIYGITILPNGNWTNFVSIPDSPSNGFDNNQWYSDGDTAIAHFEGCAPAPVCADLDITAPTTISADNAGNTQPIAIDVDDTTGAPWDGTYTYSSTNPTGFPTTCEFRKTGVLPWIPWANPYTTNAETVNVRNCSPAEVIQVRDNSAPSVCNDNLAIDNACSDLTITSPTTIPVSNLNTPTQITITSDAASGGNNTRHGTSQYTSNTTCIFSATQVASQAGIGQGTLTTTRKIMWVNECGEN